MSRASLISEFSDPAVARQVKEILKAVNSVTFKPADGDVDEDGTPRHDSAPEQMDGRYVQFESKGPGIEVEVRHSYGRVPVGFIETARSTAAALVGFPNDPAVNRSWRKDRVFFRPQTAAGTKHRVLLF